MAGFRACASDDEREQKSKLEHEQESEHEHEHEHEGLTEPADTPPRPAIRPRLDNRSETIYHCR
jgi:hypothetical protein